MQPTNTSTNTTKNARKIQAKIQEQVRIQVHSNCFMYPNQSEKPQTALLQSRQTVVYVTLLPFLDDKYELHSAVLFHSELYCTRG